MQKVKNKLEVSFGKKVTVEGKTAKVHVKEIDEVGIFQLNQLNRVGNVGNIKLKRSGTGITILVSVR